MTFTDWRLYCTRDCSLQERNWIANPPHQIIDSDWSNSPWASKRGHKQHLIYISKRSYLCKSNPQFLGKVFYRIFLTKLIMVEVQRSLGSEGSFTRFHMVKSVFFPQRNRHERKKHRYSQSLRTKKELPTVLHDSMYITCIRMWTYVHIHIHIYIYVCMCMYIHTKSYV